MQIAIRGRGKMARVLEEYISTTSHTVVGRVGRGETFNTLKTLPDVIIDFSSREGIGDMLSYATEHHIPICIATTGYNDKDMREIERACQCIPICKANNTSIGIPLIVSCIDKIIATLGESEVEIIETHHSGKVDAPSGTAKMIGSHIAKRIGGRVVAGTRGKRERGDIGISSVRIGNVVGKHEIIVSTVDEDISITHTAHSRRPFAVGAIRIAQWLQGKRAGLYSEEDVYAITL